MSSFTFVYQLWSGDWGIFLTQETYDHLCAIDRALKQSKTWGEFRTNLAEGEFEHLRLWWANDGEYIYRDGDEVLGIDRADMHQFQEAYGDAVDSFVIRSDTAFNMYLVPGVEEAEYPPWLTSTADELLPGDFVKKYGKGVASMVSGSWVEYPVERLEEMTRELAAAGHAVIPHLSYEFE